MPKSNTTYTEHGTPKRIWVFPLHRLYSYLEWYKYQFWRFVQVQDAVEELAKSAIEFPPMQKGSSFTMEAVAAQIRAAIAKNQANK